MSLSSVPAPSFTQSGLALPADADILAGVQADMNAAFGGGLNPALETPQGQLASSLSAIVADKNAELALLVNQFDPQYADGRFQDALARIYFLTRNPATSTAVAVTLTGVAGTVVPAATLAQDTNGQVYANSGSVTIGAGGTVTAQFQNVASGPIPCAAGTLTQVYQSISGWDAITNPAAGVVGADVESRADFEHRRKNSVAGNAHGSPQAIYAAVFAVPGVLDVHIAENYTGAPITVGGYTLAPHSIYVAAVGGSDAAVAAAIWSKKDIGCDMNGNTSVTVTDPSGYSYPPPTYVMKFQRPAALPIFFEVQIINDPTLPANIATLIQNAILARFNGTDGTQRERIGSTVFASRYYGAVAIGNVSLLAVLIGTSAPALLTQVPVGIGSVPTLNAANILVTLV